MVFAFDHLSIWDASGERLRLPIALPFLSPDGRWLLDNNRLIDLSLLTAVLPQTGVREVSWSPDGQLATKIEVYNFVENGQFVKVSQFLPLQVDGIGSISPAFGVSWSADSHRVVLSPGLHHPPYVVDARTGEILVILQSNLTQCAPEDRMQNCLYFAQAIWSVAEGDNQIASLGIGFGVEGYIVVWDAGTGQARLNIPLDDCFVESIAFSPDGRSLAGACSSSGEVGGLSTRVWNTQTGELVSVLRQQDEIPISIDWSPDGRRIAIGYQSGVVILWDANTWQPVYTFAGHDEVVHGLQWSPDSQYILSISGWYEQPGLALLWNPVNGHIIQHFSLKNCHQLCGGDWSPDGRWLAFTNMQIYRAYTNLDELISFSKEHYTTRSLSIEERALFGLPTR